MKDNDISYKIRGAIFRVYKHFGPGLLESVYVAALEADLKDEGVKVRKEVAVPVYYGKRKARSGI